MADIVSTIALTGADSVVESLGEIGQAGVQAFKALTDAANEAAKALASIKPPPVDKRVKELGDDAEKAGSKIGEMAEKIAGVGKSIAGNFGEAGKLLGELGEGAAKSLGGIAEGFAAASEAGGGFAATLGTIGVAASAGFAALAAGAAAIVGFSAESAENYNKLAAATRTTVDEFRELDAVGASFGLTASQTAEIVKTIGAGIREGALAAHEMAEQWNLLGERIQYMQDRTALQATQRRESEISAREQAEQSAHSIEQAERNVARAREDYARGGAKMTPDEKEMRQAEDRTNRLKDAEHALAEARQKAADEVRKNAERRQQEQVQEERQATRQAALQLSQQRQARASVEQAPPVERAFVQYAQQVQGVKDLGQAFEVAAQKMDEFKQKTPKEQLAGFLQTLDELKTHGVDISRILVDTFGDMAAKVGEHLHEMAGAAAKSPEDLQKMLDGMGIRSKEVNDRLAETAEGVQKLERQFLEMGVKVGGALLSLAEPFKPLITALGNVLGLLGSIIEVAGKAVEAVKKVVGGQTPEEKKKEDEHRKTETQKERRTAEADPEAYRRQLVEKAGISGAPGLIAGAAAFDIMNILKQIFGGGKPQPLQTPGIIDEMAKKAGEAKLPPLMEEKRGKVEPEERTKAPAVPEAPVKPPEPAAAKPPEPAAVEPSILQKFFDMLPPLFATPAKAEEAPKAPEKPSEAIPAAAEGSDKAAESLGKVATPADATAESLAKVSAPADATAESLGKVSAPADATAESLAKVPDSADATETSLNKIPAAADAAAAALSKLGAGGGGGGGEKPSAPATATEGKASGGAVGGWGSGKSDSVPIMASKGEFVVTADGGNLGDAISYFRRRHIPGFQSGGIVRSSVPSTMSDTDEPNDSGPTIVTSGSEPSAADEARGYNEAIDRAIKEIRREEKEKEDEKRLKKLKEECDRLSARVAEFLRRQPGVESSLQQHIAGARALGNYEMAMTTFEDQYLKAKQEMEKACDAVKEFEHKLGVESQIEKLEGKKVKAGHEDTGPSTINIPESSADDEADDIPGFAGGGIVGGCNGSDCGGGIHTDAGLMVANLAQTFTGGGLVNGFVNSVATIPGYASGGPVSGTSGSSNSLSHHTLDIRTSAGTFQAKVDDDTMEAIRNSALSGKLSQTGTRPSWYS